MTDNLIKKEIEEFKRRRSLMNYSQIWKIHPMGVAEDIDEFFEQALHKVKDEAKREASVEILSKASDKLVDYKPKPNFSFKAIQWDDLFDICSLKEDGGEDKTKWK